MFRLLPLRRDSETEGGDALLPMPVLGALQAAVQCACPRSGETSKIMPTAAAAAAAATCCGSGALGRGLLLPPPALMKKLKCRKIPMDARNFWADMKTLSCLPACLLLLHCPYYLCCGTSCCW